MTCDDMWWHVMTYSYDIDIYIDHHRNHVRNRNICSCQGNSVSEGCSITKSEWLVPTHLVAGSDFGHLGAWNTGRILEFHGIFNRKIWKGYQHVSTQYQHSEHLGILPDASIKHQSSSNEASICCSMPRLFGIILTLGSCWWQVSVVSRCLVRWKIWKGQVTATNLFSSWSSIRTTWKRSIIKRATESVATSRSALPGSSRQFQNSTPRVQQVEIGNILKLHEITINYLHLRVSQS